MDSAVDETDVWFWDNSRWRLNQYSSSKAKRFVLNKVCPNCGAKIYWLTGKDRLICPNCGEQLLSLTELAKLIKAASIIKSRT